ncbi:MAG: nucleotide pyrophosphohydrolase [Nitrospinae bacterium]|nr:nucleotide pyrophosphohydrolase [Nitrospinota bacterium]
MEELLKDIRQFNEERDWGQFHTPKNLAMSLAIEVAEVMEHFQWLTQEEGNNLSIDKKREISEELGDVMIYLVNLADKLNIDLLKAAQMKIEKNRRRYPITKAKGNSNKYLEL